MGRITAHLLARFRAWDRSAQIALIIALILIVLVLALGRLGPDDVREPALIGLLGLLIAVQVIVLWANRGMVTPYTQAQRHYLAGDFEAACAVLEKARQAGKADFRALALLGNAYRQQNRLDDSITVLEAAIAAQPNHHFPLYGFGRTLLIQGHYAEAADAFDRALEAGASPVAHLDAADAYFRLRNADAAQKHLLLTDSDEPHRQLLRAYLLHRLGAGDPPAEALIQAGLPYWEANAARYADTPYGVALAADVRWLQARLEEI